MWNPIRSQILRTVAFLATVCAVAWLPAPAASAQGQTTIRLDHSSGTIRLLSGGREQLVRAGEPIRIPSGRRVAVVVDGTNSALYACRLSQEPISVPELDTLKLFTGQIGDYLPLIASRMGLFGQRFEGEDGPHQRLEAAASAVRTHLQSLNELVEGPDGMKAAHLQVVAALAQMRRSPDRADADAAAELRAWLDDEERCEGAECEHLTYPRQVLARLELLRQYRQDLANEIAALRTNPPPVPDSLQPAATALEEEAEALHTAADQALSGGDDLLKEALALERIAVRTHRAKSELECETVQVSWDSGRALTLNVAPHPEPEVALVAFREPMERKAEVLPDWLIRPSLGLTFLAAPGAKYTNYTTRTVEQGEEIVQGDVEDRRFTYGLTLALTYRGLDRRRESGWALWLPDLTINPLSDVRAVGIGGGVSYRMLKVGTGLLFTRHVVLNGQSVGQVLGASSDLRTRESFGRGRIYVGVSMMGLPPFLPELE